MGFFRQKIQGFKKRAKHLSYGIVYFRAGDFRIPTSFWVNGRSRKICFSDSDSGSFLYEFDEICIRDCYQLHLLTQALRKVDAIADIGANQGLFLLAARKQFPRARIDGYEPNPELQEILSANAAALNAGCYFEAVARTEGKVKLHFSASDLHTISEMSEEGSIPAISLRKIIERAGGTIDLLKMDCEGAEWDLLEDGASWTRINSVTLEYHLWAKPGSTAEDIKERLTGLGFRIIAHNPISDQFGLVTAIRKDFIDK